MPGGSARSASVGQAVRRAPGGAPAPAESGQSRRAGAAVRPRPPAPRPPAAGQPLPRVGGVERHVGAAGLRMPRRPPPSPASARRRAPPRPRARPPAAAGAGRARGAPVELAVGHRAHRPSHDTATASGPRRRLLREQRVDAGGAGSPTPCRSTPPASWWRSARASSGRLGERQLRRVGDAPPGEERRVVAEQRAAVAAVEEVGRVLQARLRSMPSPPAARLQRREREVELRRRRSPRRAARGAGPGSASVLAGRQRSAARSITWNSGLRDRLALRPQLLDQLLEGQVLVGEGRRAPSSRTRREQPAEARSPAQVARAAPGC